MATVEFNPKNPFFFLLSGLQTWDSWKLFAESVTPKLVMSYKKDLLALSLTSDIMFNIAQWWEMIYVTDANNFMMASFCNST